MQKTTQQDVINVLDSKRRRSLWQKIVGALACLVVFCTTYALILPAITMEKKPACAKTEHTHTEACYTQTMDSVTKTVPVCTPERLGLHWHTAGCWGETGEYICGYSDFFVHVHDAICYDEEGNLWCPLPEIVPHMHGEDCYAQPEPTPEPDPVHTHTDECYATERGELICQEQERDGHVHSVDAGCFDESGMLICQTEETEEHWHTDSCYEQRQTLICELPEGAEEPAPDEPYPDETAPEAPSLDEPAEPEPICGRQEIILHEHDVFCLDGNGLVICGMPQVLYHQHTDDCFETVDEAADPTALTCPLMEGEGAHVHNEADGCFDETGVIICQQEETGGHQHSFLCYGTWELTCELEEHTHSDDCFETAEPQTETPEQWESSFAYVNLSGNWAQDTLAIARTQMGYTESSENCITADDGVTQKGYTRYGDWWGDPYGDWCAMFIAFCMDYAGVPDTVFPRDASCEQWVRQLSDAALYCPAWEDVPSQGDLVFFDFDYDGLADHVGLVQELLYDADAPVQTPEDALLDEESLREIDFETSLFADWEGLFTCEEAAEPRPSGFTTIEGNRNVGFGDQVAEMQYTADDPTILGYGRLSAFGGAEVQTETGRPGGTDWGYAEDGSIYWGTDFTRTVSAEDIQSNTPYIIAGNSKVNVLTSEADAVDPSLLAADRPSNKREFQNYAIWYFEKMGDGGNLYRIYCTPDSGNPESRRYLKLEVSALSTTGDVNEASTFTVGQSTFAGYTDRIFILSDQYYINSYGGDVDSCKGWGGWNELDAGSSLYLIPADGITERTANRVPTDISTNTVINLFDYWISDNRTDPDNVDGGAGSGINEDHVFKFSRGSSLEEPINKWTGAGELPLQGIVANTLGADGYPYLSGNVEKNGIDSTESLNYLFDPTDTETAGKASYRNVGGLLTVDSEGYYAFDCKKNMAEFNQASNTIYLYDQPGVYRKNGGQKGQFFPFNYAPQVMEAVRDDADLNHYFGLTLTTRFVQRHDGYADEKHRTPTTFHFSGDDDVWIFIDGVLVGDVGGIHDACSVDIDFSTGEVEVKVAGYNTAEKTVTTTLYQCYENAQKVKANDWKTNTFGQKVFANNTTHTLKFFYLERGNYESNLELRYNLTEIPETAIYKVDQYGQVVPGATFAVYAANSNYQMLSNKGGNVIEEPEEPSYDGSGNLLGADNSILAHALYTGVTDKEGEMTFVDPDGMPYSLIELEDLFGRNFILREIKVPEGYRVVSKDADLEIWRGGSQAILKCANTFESGSRAAATLQVTATDTLYLQKGDTYEARQYVDEQGDSNGTLFAVVYRYTGELTDGLATDLEIGTNWTPVYGSDAKGYTLVKEGGSVLERALTAAKAGTHYGDVVFTLSPSSTMQLTLENLPGHITQYYRMLGEHEKGLTRYTVGYYWTEADSLEGATVSNTHRVLTYPEMVSQDLHYSGFERVFGANIQVPNLINKVLVQKVDENDTRIDGATFALYQVEQQTDGSIWYLADDGRYEALPAAAITDENGVITGDKKTFRPLRLGVTGTYTDGVHEGTAEFSNLADGQYIVKEVKAPAGYQLNPTPVMVLITEDTIYANAGTEDDGVAVGRGPGYVVSTLSEFASEGQIDNTLSWIYAQMRISALSTSFADVAAMRASAQYLVENNSAKTSEDAKNAARSYLKYDIDAPGTAFNYVPNEVHNDDPHATGTRRLFTTAGWPYYEIYQDYEYGMKLSEELGANYEDWRGRDLTNLFSRSTYIRVRDLQETTVTVKKVDMLNQDRLLSGAQFRLYRVQTGEKADITTKEYYCRSESTGAEAAVVSWEADVQKALVLTTNENGTMETGFTGLTDGTYYLEEIQAPVGYHRPDKPIGFTIKMAVLTTAETPTNGIAVEDELDENNLYTYTITVPNSTGYELPSTGGAGTCVFYVLGSLLSVCAGVLLLGKVGRKRFAAD